AQTGRSGCQRKIQSALGATQPPKLNIWDLLADPCAAPTGLGITIYSTQTSRSGLTHTAPGGAALITLHAAPPSRSGCAPYGRTVPNHPAKISRSNHFFIRTGSAPKSGLQSLYGQVVVRYF